MKTAAKLATTAALLILGNAPATAQDALLQPREDEVLVGPVPFVQNVLGVPLSTQVSAFLALRNEGNQLRIDARIVADLSELQQKAGALVDTIPLPTDNCAHFGLDNMVARIWGKRIIIDGDTATLKLNGDADIWTCAKNPVPCTRVEWNEQNVLGAKIRTPRLVAYDCNPPIKNRNINQPFEASLPFRLTVVDSHTVSVELGTPTVNLTGALGNVTDEILKIAGVELNGRVKEALDQAINPDLLKRSLPEELLRLNPVITRAELLSNSGTLAASIEMNAAVDDKALADLVQALEPGPQSTD